MSIYRALGVTLVTIGVLFALAFSVAFPLVPLAAIGLSAIIVGLTSIFLSRSRSGISAEACEILAKAGVANMTAILEGLGTKNKAVYIPRSMNGGYPHAIVHIGGQERLDAAKERLLGSLLDIKTMTIKVTTPGCIALGLLKSQPGPTAEEIRSAIAHVLVGELDIGESVKVDVENSHINVQVTGSDMRYRDNPYYRCFGSPVGSIVAAISSEALQKPVRILEESDARGTNHIALEVLS